MSALFYVMIVSAIAAATAYGLDPGVAAYSVSFWHYFTYWLAYIFRAVPHAAFKRDAILMKSVSLAVLGWAFFSGNPDILSLIVVTFGFALNAYAAIIMGSDRSYYGYELGGLPYQRITSFPYSITAHPMLIGNIVAFGGLLINAEFRENWWPLAIMHMAMNAGLLIMETKLDDRANMRSLLMNSTAFRSVIYAAALLLGAGFGYAASKTLGPAMGMGLGILASVNAIALYRFYAPDLDKRSVRQNITDGKTA
jgi:hypothetical protein